MWPTCNNKEMILVVVWLAESTNQVNTLHRTHIWKVACVLSNTSTLLSQVDKASLCCIGVSSQKLLSIIVVKGTHGDKKSIETHSLAMWGSGSIVVERGFSPEMEMAKPCERSEARNVVNVSMYGLGTLCHRYPDPSEGRSGKSVEEFIDLLSQAHW